MEEAVIVNHYFLHEGVVLKQLLGRFLFILRGISPAELLLFLSAPLLCRVQLILKLQVAEARLREPLEPVLFELELGAKQYFLFESCLEVDVLPDDRTVHDEVKETLETHVVPADICDNHGNLFLSPARV